MCLEFSTGFTIMISLFQIQINTFAQKQSLKIFLIIRIYLFVAMVTLHCRLQKLVISRVQANLLLFHINTVYQSFNIFT